MPFLPPPSFQQIKDVPLKIELPEPIKADIGAPFATVAAVDGPEATGTFFQSAESVTTRLVEYVDGPFRHLRNRWRFRDIPGDSSEQKRSEVEFFIDYEFRSRTLGALMGAVFDDAFRKFTTAFEQRADKVYGRN